MPVAKNARECFNRITETGVLHVVGLRDTLEPDPDNTGVGSFRSLAAFFLHSSVSSPVSFIWKQGEFMSEIAAVASVRLQNRFLALQESTLQKGNAGAGLASAVSFGRLAGAILA